ncbi:unnamed protein product, partial [Brachionus calyciflorus]
MKIKGTICYIVSDNLAANESSLVERFSSRVSGLCRFCTADNDDKQHKFNEDELISRIKSSSTIGIKANCCLNDLQYFKIFNGQPPDIMHDFLEGVLCLNFGLLNDSIRRFVSVDELKSQLENFKYGRHDGKNKVPFDVFTDRSINKTNGFKLSATQLTIRFMEWLTAFEIEETETENPIIESTKIAYYLPFDLYRFHTQNILLPKTSVDKIISLLAKVDKIEEFFKNIQRIYDVLEIQGLLLIIGDSGVPEDEDLSERDELLVLRADQSQLKFQLSKKDELINNLTEELNSKKTVQFSGFRQSSRYEEDENLDDDF